MPQWTAWKKPWNNILVKQIFEAFTNLRLCSNIYISWNILLITALTKATEPGPEQEVFLVTSAGLIFMMVFHW